MAINRLTDIVGVFETKWTYGDSKFEYDFEINKDHDIQYPVLQIEPPTSTIPEIYNGREEYEFEINFYNLYSQAAQDVVTLQKRWDNLQDLAMEWLDMVLKHYQDSTVEAYLNDESVEIERIKEVANDRLVQIKMSFTMSGFTKCFRPQSSYPSDINADNLLVWLRADSGLTFDIPTKRVSLWADQSGNGNDIGQSTSGLQPLRYGYDGASDKARIEFDGTNDYLSSGDEGSDVIVNGTFDTTIALGTAGSGWASMDSPLNPATYDSGGCKIQRAAALCRLRARTVVGGNSILMSGRVYKLTYEVTGNNACTSFEIYHGGTSTSINETVGTHSIFFIEGATNQYFEFRNSTNASDITIDNVVVNEVPSGLCPITNESFGMFMVAKTTTDPLTDDVRYFGYLDDSDDRIVLGSDANRLQFKVVDDNNVSAEVQSVVTDLTTSYHIASARFDGSVGVGTVSLQYNNETEVTATIAGYVHTGGWDDQVFTIGWVLDGAVKNYLKGDIQEIIIYNKTVSNADRDLIKNYLNNKYNIY